MTNLINTITINGQSTTFLNYVNPVVSAEPYAMTDANCRSVLTTAWGATKVVVSEPYTWLLPPGDPLFTGTASFHKLRFEMYSFGTVRLENQINSSTNSASKSLVQALDPQASLSSSTHTFGVINPFGFIFASFTSNTRATLNSLILRSWLKNGIFTGNQRTRNVVGLDIIPGGTIRTFFRPLAEGATTRQELLKQNPSLLCSVATPSANASEIIVRDSVSPNNYIGQLWNMIMMPSSCVVGKIYKNTGIDPDTGQIETDQKAFWMCLGNWGANKIGMRVWTEDIT